MFARAAIILFWALLALAPAGAQTLPPRPSELVADIANVIPADRKAVLSQKLRAIKDATGRSVIVATIPNTQGYPLSDYGYRLGRAWKIGEKGANNGALLYIAPGNPTGQRGPRIEVGYGLEPILTDAMSYFIIYDKMMPILRKNQDIPAALDAGVDAIAEQLKLPPDQAATRAKQIEQKRAQNRHQGIDIGSVIFWLAIFFFFILPMIRGIFGRRSRYGRRYGSGPVVIWGPSFGGGSSWGGGGSSWGESGSSSNDDFFGGGSFGGGGASGDW